MVCYPTERRALAFFSQQSPYFAAAPILSGRSRNARNKRAFISRKARFSPKIHKVRSMRCAEPFLKWLRQRTHPKAFPKPLHLRSPKQARSQNRAATAGTIPGRPNLKAPFQGIRYSRLFYRQKARIRAAWAASKFAVKCPFTCCGGNLEHFLHIPPNWPNCAGPHSHKTCFMRCTAASCICAGPYRAKKRQRAIIWAATCKSGASGREPKAPGNF